MNSVLQFLQSSLFRGLLQSLVVVLFTLQSYGKISFPSSMDKQERRQTLELLGPATSSRMLSSPYPLGGWEGFEVGISRHYVPMSYLSEVDNTFGYQRDIEYPILTLGKGLYYDFDLFLSLVPMIQSEAVNHFSTQIRHQFWQSEEGILRLSGLLYAGTTTLNNQINMQSYGFDALGTITIDRVSMYLGLGSSFNNGRFIGGAGGLNATASGSSDPAPTEVETITLPHQLIGLEWPIDSFFLALEVDRFKVPYYSMKLGYRHYH